MPPQLISLLGIVVILVIAVLLSNARKLIRLRVVAAAFALQAGIAGLVLRTDGGAAVIQGMANGVAALLSYADAGTQFLFGDNDANPLSNTFALGALPRRHPDGEDYHARHARFLARSGRRGGLAAQQDQRRGAGGNHGGRGIAA